MFSLKRLSMTCGALFVLAGFVFPASAGEFAENRGPVGPHKPILTEVGNKRVIAFYEAGNDRCGLHLVVWNRADETGGSSARLRVSLRPRQMVQIDSPDNKSLNLQRGDSAEVLRIVDPRRVIAAGAAN